MACRSAKSLARLRAEIRTAFPGRDERSDGGCASADHTRQNPTSDHEPNAAGVARAYDYDSDLRPGQPSAEMFTIAEHLRRLGEYGDHRLVGGSRNGYIIFFGKIAGAGKGWHWRTYTGPNAHKSHMHVSVCSNPAGYDDGAAPWHIADLFRRAPEPQEDDMPLKIVKCREHPGGLYLTDCATFVRTLSGPALDHGRNLGYYPKAEDAVPHDWLVWIDQAQDGHHNPTGV